MRLFRVRSFAVANATGFAFSLGMFGAVFLLAQDLLSRSGTRLSKPGSAPCRGPARR
jgi:hypothetical protein